MTQRLDKRGRFAKVSRKGERALPPSSGEGERGNRSPESGGKAEEALIATVALPVPVEKTFSYRIPEDLASKAVVGCRVVVPFTNRILTGYILYKELETSEIELKDVLKIPDGFPLFPEAIVAFFEWIAEYYRHPIGLVIQSLLPPGADSGPVESAAITEEGLQALRSLPTEAKESEILAWVRDHPDIRVPFSSRDLRSLERKGWALVTERASTKSTRIPAQKFVRPRQGVDFRRLMEQTAAKKRPAANETAFLKTVSQSSQIPLRELRSEFPNGSYLVEKWVKKKVLELYEAPATETPHLQPLFGPPRPSRLFPQQQAALDRIFRYLDAGTFAACLIHGVTGSGKTEVYYAAAEHAVAGGFQVILMVPEIALATYLEGVFRSRMGDRIAIYHSGLNERKRREEWMRMLEGKADVVVGARSALFAPFSKLGLIVVDEEHDTAYKQEGKPCYQARDAAVVRAKKAHAVVVLGSGTPSVQSYHNAVTGRYQLISMPNRIERRPLPHVEVMDMKQVDPGSARNPMISPRLEEALRETLSQGNQSILFLNRRGFHRVHLCRACGEALHCPNCDVALTYHLKRGELRCHYCGFRAREMPKCVSCGCPTFRAYGFGTERLEHELAERFPEAAVRRMDTDSTRRKDEAYHILKGFSERRIDILVGTQMITKGYDFPRVTLVGVIAADLSLAFPDFRGGERTFQILSQVAGRAGRGDRKGRVIIQTYNPSHYAIRAATSHDFRSFFEKETALRAELGYPPFSHLACLRLQGTHKRKTEQAVHEIGKTARTVMKRWTKTGKEIQVLGPAEAPISRIKGKYRWQLLVKGKGPSVLHKFLRDLDRASKNTLQAAGVHFTADVDPYHMT